MLEVQSLSGGYGKKIICKDVSFTLKYGETLCIVGPNGSGKTTLIKLVLNLLKKTNGDIQVDAKSIATYSTNECAKILAYVPQQHSIAFSLTVFEMVLMGRTSYVPNFSIPSKLDEEYVLTILEQLSLQHLAYENYDTLSGGQKQMVLIARALCQESKILIMDEPTASLDYYNQSIVIKTIQELSKQGYSIIVTSHNLSQPFLYAHNSLVLKKGEVYAFGNTQDVLTKEILTNVYELNMDVIHTTDSNGNKRTFCIPL